MTLSVAAAIMLECFFAPPADGSVPADSVQRARTPLPAAVVESMRAGRPPTNGTAFVGEAPGTREWLIAATRDPAATYFRVLRVSMSTNPSLPSPYAARLGTVHVSADRRTSRFEEQMVGWCKLNPVEGTPQ